ncbi:hypothetical protein LTR78_010460 [Recurvomyces mirabilis]|uniref:Uncharacterized protein n=1 Tax=Recurvomyces mirabilis TaxID=574656 RepID=A0AAE0TM96_9PEZI|nr:hypothetical protein LTR78_010460 [Recurvomyces mirabilis]KAK4570566.1 hypothetical protein LTR86_002648 [Recurvomyces mirabilis]KAK5150353.1 hypothetical protein LTS14_010192 [Recurvomyces mirabilis]
MQNTHEETMSSTWLEDSQTTVNNEQHLVKDYQAMTVNDELHPSETSTSSMFPPELDVAGSGSGHASPPPTIRYSKSAASYPILIADTTSITVSQLTQVEQWLFDRLPTTRHPQELARHLLHNDGQQMTSEDVMMLYRIAYWKSKPWEDIDTVSLTRLVKEDMDQIWDRVATKMQDAGRPQWPPSELKARYFSTGPVINSHAMLS